MERRNIQGKKNKYIPNENIYSLSPSKKQRRHNSNTFHNFEQFVVLNHKKNKIFSIKLTVPFSNKSPYSSSVSGNILLNIKNAFNFKKSNQMLNVQYDVYGI